MSKLLTAHFSVYIGVVIALASPMASASLLPVTANQKAKVEQLIHARFGTEIRDVTYTAFSYDQAGYEALVNVIPGISVRGVTFVMKNGTPVNCAWTDSASKRVIVLKRCELKLNSKIDY